MDIKQQVQSQFGKNAANYVTSRLHAQGDDLKALVELAQAEGSRGALDIATGGGHVANALAAFIESVTACDLTEAMLEQARKFIAGQGRTNVSFAAGDAESLPFANEAFDLVTCRIAAHHFPDPDAFVREAFRVLAPGGSFLLIDNVAPEENELDEWYNDIEKRRDHSHVRAWKKSEWLARIERSGFRVKQLRVFPKPFEFRGWTERMGLPPEAAAELEKRMVEAPERVRKHFQVEIENGRVHSFQGESILVQARKPL
ncbi:class I SAM-dependent methyltransferase [Paenibacillus hamazuiensis]|uniref:class I SAM-dependent methyltransferase n=1 Tax=Paenibacillus hamazuiensis TaxID=2936508 RepID=UPI00200E27AA|nr:class I SAM-dependent methyltransferase [Paenibacillus hamazuiensis]